MQLNDTHKLVRKDTGAEVLPGETVTDFRGDPDVFRYVSKAPGGPSQGKIITDRGFELYPSVFGLRIVPRDGLPGQPEMMRVRGFSPLGKPFATSVPTRPVSAGDTLAIGACMHQVVAVDADGTVHVGRGYF